MIRIFFTRYKFPLLLLAIMLLCELIVNPLGNFPLNDDWSYSKSVLNWFKNGEVNIGEWPAMTLFTHLAWGLMFTKVAGFSFFVLRVSGLVSSFIGIQVLYRLVKEITANERIAFFASLVLLFNPVYFCLSNTYMTDVNFTTLLILACFFAFRFFKTNSALYFVLVFIVSALLVFTRQFGFMVPVGFTLACLLNKGKRWLYVALALLFTTGIYFALKVYEDYLHTILSPEAAYVYLGGMHITESGFWESFYALVKERFVNVILHVLVYTLPLNLLFLPGLLKQQKRIWSTVFFLVILSLSYFLFRAETFPIGNVFYDTGVGTESFYESLCPLTDRHNNHTHTEIFVLLMLAVKILFAALNCLFICLRLSKLKSIKFWKFSTRPEISFLIITTGAYIFLLMVSSSYFDRYHLPLILLAILLLSYSVRQLRPEYGLSILLLSVMFFVSVFGTKDYLTINRAKWEAYNYLAHTKKVSVHKINAGFEPNYWHEGTADWWHLSYNGKTYQYLIQYWQEPGYHIYKKYGFQKYFPYQKDTLFIFERKSP